jgi:hypothetical protein
MFSRARRGLVCKSTDFGHREGNPNLIIKLQLIKELKYSVGVK